ncbi:MAG: hypothetical protein PVI19_04965, partial [Syntrophobacterales bacterium]
WSGNQGPRADLTPLIIQFIMKMERSLGKKRPYLLRRVQSLAADFDTLSCGPAQVKPNLSHG